MSEIFLGSVSIPDLDTIWPRYAIRSLKNSHFEGFNFSPASLIFWKTPLSLIRCSSGVLENTITSSK